MQDDSAVSSVYQFAVGGAVFVLLTSLLLTTTGSVGQDDAASTAAIDAARAEALAEVALSASWAWSEGDGALAAGLRTDSGGIDMAAMERFKHAPWETQDEGRVAYTEARSLWGVQPFDAFHMRIGPLPATGLYDLSGLRVAYVGAWTDVSSVHADFGTGRAMTADMRTELDAAMTGAAATERAVLAAVGADFDNRVHLTGAGPALLVDTVVPAGGRAFVCHDGSTIEVAASAVAFHALHGDPVGPCADDTPAGKVVSVPLFKLVDDMALLEGDVYLDDVDYLDGAMASRWDQYDVIVIGSGAAPQALGQGGFPAGLRDHVERGGLLVVFGGTSQDAWLAPLASQIAATSNQEAATPDHQHPLLRWPHAVDWHAMDVGHTLAEERFPDATWQHVLGDQELLLSPLGAFAQDGLVVATSVRPAGIDGVALATNVLAYYARQDLHLDFGMTRPDGHAAAGAAMTVWGEDLGGNQVPLRIQFLYWRG